MLAPPLMIPEELLDKAVKIVGDTIDAVYQVRQVGAVCEAAPEVALSATRLLGRPVADAIWADVERRAASLRRLVARRCRASPSSRRPTIRRPPRTCGRSSGRSSATAWPPIRRRPNGSARKRSSGLLTSSQPTRRVHGILMTQPLPAPLSLERALAASAGSKDVEGVHPENAGLLAQGRPGIVPSTPLAGMEILKAAGIELQGKTAVVVGRSPIVGRPLIQLLLAEHATVTVCHTRTA